MRKKWGKAKPSLRKAIFCSLGTVVIIAIIVSISIWADSFPEWTGISGYDAQTTVQTTTLTTTQITTTRGKTLWDFMELLIVPIVLAGIAIWFNRRMRDAEKKATDEQLREEALQLSFR